VKLISFSETIYASFRKSAGAHHCVMEAHRDYVITAHQAQTLLKDHEPIRQRLFKFSELNPRLTSFNVGARRAGTQRILLYNGSGGYGDQIITWPLAKILSEIGFDVHVLADPGNLVCWSNFPFIKATLTLPIPYEVLKLYDYHLLYDYVVNADEHPSQQHPLDTMLNQIGIPPQSVKPEQKVVAPIFTVSEMRAMMGAFSDKTIAIYQLSAALGVRSLVPDESAALLGSLATAYPDWHWLAIHDDFIPKDYVEKTTALRLGNVQTVNQQILRELWALTKRAAIVIAPDSMMVHVAGSMGVPCVGLWGPVDPGLRVNYYKGHVPIFKKEACAYAPCHTCNGEWPRYCPKRESRKQCDVISAITHQDVIDAIVKATGTKPSATPVRVPVIEAPKDEPVVVTKPAEAAPMTATVVSTPEEQAELAPATGLSWSGKKVDSPL